MTTMRIFLEDLAYTQDPSGFMGRFEQVLVVCAKNGIKPLFGFFSLGPDKNPVVGKQPKPVPGTVSSGWNMSPGSVNLTGPSKWGQFETYIKDVIGTYANDDRVLGWDLWNEPDNGLNSNEVTHLNHLFPQVFNWARSVDPIQPLTSSVWRGDYAFKEKYDTNEWLQINCSDVISFHNYDNPSGFESKLKELQQWKRPIIATEYMARSRDNEYNNVLPLGIKYNIGMISWGWVNGKMQYQLPWGSNEHNAVEYPPWIWFQDVFRNGVLKPYLLEEAQLLKRLNGCPQGQLSQLNNWTCNNTYDTKLSFTDAHAACKAKWSNLVTIESAFENAYIRGLASSAMNCDTFYIGLENTTTHSWTWQYSLTGPYNNPSYRNWKTGYPLNGTNASCVVLNKVDGSWSNQDCSIPACYICSY